MYVYIYIYICGMSDLIAMNRDWHEPAHNVQNAQTATHRSHEQKLAETTK